MRLAASPQLEFDSRQELARLGLVAGRTLASSAGTRVLRSFGQRVTRRKVSTPRIEADLLFEKVAAALGRIQVLKREDSGPLLSRDGRAEAPDFRVMLPQGEQVLVEVVTGTALARPAKIAPRRIDALTDYALKSGCALRIAIYWRDAGLWTLTPASAFTSDGTLDLPTAIMWNDMVRFGDYLLGTVYPLKMNLTSEPAGQGKRRITSLEFFAGNAPLRDKEEGDLALFLMLFGDWQATSEPPSEFEDRPVAVTFEVQPRELANPGQPFEMVGYASTILSRYFAEVARDDRTARDFVPPDMAGLVVRRRSESFPLWRFEVSPKQAESADDVTSRLDAVYSREGSTIDESFERASNESLSSEDW